MNLRTLHSSLAAFSCLLASSLFAAGTDDAAGPNRPIGEAKGIHPGRVVWVHDSRVLDWRGPGDGHWYQGNHTRQDRANAMMAQAVRELTGETTVGKAWDKLFRHFNRAHGKSDSGYKPGEKVFIKPNWVGLIWRGDAVDPETYALKRQQDYMNTSPQLIVALLSQLVNDAGVKQSDITVSDTLSYLANEYYEILHSAFPEVRYADYGGKFRRIKVKESEVPFFWSCRPDGKTADYLPDCIAEADYLVNFANLKAHMGAGITLCGKNHFGSLVRWPVQPGYYDMHRNAMAQQESLFREQVDLMGHPHLGGKTVLYLVDGLFSGKHPVDTAPRKMSLAPFNGDWPKSLFASQDPVAIDSVGFDFLAAEYSDPCGRPGVDGYLHEAALADNPPSGTFYDPEHATPVKRLQSLGVHEHWNNAGEKQYSRSLGTGKGIELVPVDLGSSSAANH